VPIWEHTHRTNAILDKIRGEYYAPTRMSYHGEIERGVFHGHGKLQFHGIWLVEDDEVLFDELGTDSYEGEFKDGVPHGHGTHIIGDYGHEDHKYVGGFRDGLWHGKGTLWTCLAGNIESLNARIEGEFAYGKPHGEAFFFHILEDEYCKVYEDGKVISETPLERGEAFLNKLTGGFEWGDSLHRGPSKSGYPNDPDDNGE